jgi:hypothetical protein
MIDINGYKISGTSVARIEKILHEARKNVAEAETEIFAQLLSREITVLIDDISMNIVPRPNIPLLIAAEQMLMEKIRFAGAGATTEYNLEVSANILTDDKDTFVLLHAKNQMLIDAFQSTNGIVDYTVQTPPSALSPEFTGKQEETKEMKKWSRLRTKYGDNLVLTTMSAVLSSPVVLDETRLAFESPASRAGVRARHTITNRMLSMYASGKEIPPYKLMEYMDCAYEAAMASEENQALIEDMAIKLATVLPNITLELIKYDPRAPIETSISPAGEREETVDSTSAESREEVER